MLHIFFVVESARHKAPHSCSTIEVVKYEGVLKVTDESDSKVVHLVVLTEIRPQTIC